jgi:hypothetical protein
MQSNTPKSEVLNTQPTQIEEDATLKDTLKATPPPIQITTVKSNEVSKGRKILEIIKGTEGIEISTNSTNNVNKSIHKFKCQYFCRKINPTINTSEDNEESNDHHPRTYKRNNKHYPRTI